MTKISDLQIASLKHRLARIKKDDLFKTLLSNNFVKLITPITVNRYVISDKCSSILKIKSYFLYSILSILNILPFSKLNFERKL